jgi:hypothetical protein
LYPTWQASLREHQPPTLVIWGQGDIFFTPEGGEAYLRDLPDAELHLLDTGHFALEDKLDVMAPLIHDFLDREDVHAGILPPQLPDPPPPKARRGSGRQESVAACRHQN